MPVLTVEEVEGGPRTRKLLGDPDRCDRCNSQYAYVSSPNKEGKPGRTILACGMCGHPAPDEHPEQAKLKAAWAERDRQEKQQSDQQKRAAEMASQSPYQHVGSLALVEERFAEIERNQQRILANQDAFERRLSALEARKK